MNRPTSFTEGKTFEVVRDHHFIMTEEDVSGGRYDNGYTIGDCSTAHSFRGRRSGTQFWETIPLNTPLCKGCEGSIVDALCKDCELLHADLLPELRAETKGQWL